MSRREHNYNRPLARSEPVPQKQGDGKTFLIIVEGKKTEPLYIIGLRDALQLSSTRVIVYHSGSTDPLSMVKSAISLREAQIKRSSLTPDLPYDEVWVVVDREAQNHPRGNQLPDVLSLAKQAGIRIVLSNPCFEFWLLLHFLFTTRAC